MMPYWECLKFLGLAIIAESQLRVIVSHLSLDLLATSTELLAKFVHSSIFLLLFHQLNYALVYYSFFVLELESMYHVLFLVIGL